MEKTIIVRYGEIGIKSYRVRCEFEKILVDNISRALIENKIELEKIRQTGGRIYIWCNNVTKALKILKNVFGIVSYSPAKVIETDFEQMKKEALQFYLDSKKKKFRITTRRIFKQFPMSSMQVSAALGEHIINSTKSKVSLEKYDVNICFEIGKEYSFIFSDFYKGPGGLPLGTEGKVLCVVSKEPESWINAWLMTKRGSELVLVGSDETSGKTAKKFFKNYYYFGEEPIYVKIPKFSIEKLVEIAKKEGAKAIVLPVKQLGLFESKTNMLIFYPSLGYPSKELKKMQLSLGL